MTVYTEFGKLKKIIVGNVQNYNLEKLDKTFKIAYGENLQNSPFDNFLDYKVDKKKIEERKEDLDNLAKLLISLGVEVYRPEELSSFKTFKTPNISGVLSPATNPRDLVLIYGNKIIETPVVASKRFFEKNLFYKLFLHLSNTLNYSWLSAPYPLFEYDRIDDRYWKDSRDFTAFNKNDFDIMFDAANIIKIGKDLLFNISTYNHFLGYEWLKKILGSEVNIHPIYQLDDSHIDGKISVLKPGVFLVNNTMMERNIKDYLPKKFHDWKIIYTGDYNSYKTYDGDNIESTSFLELCSLRGHDTNVLSIDENTVLVQKFAKNTIKKLQKEGFTVIPFQLRHPEIFGGGIHCSTLDIEREDQCIDYTKHNL